MDSGILEDGESLDDDFDMSRDLLPEELIWLMDELSNREVAWMMGYPLSQTLFTSIHIDRLLWPAPIQLQDATFTREEDSSMTPTYQILRAYCLLLIKSCDLVLDMVTSQHFYEVRLLLELSCMLTISRKKILQHSFLIANFYINSTLMIFFRLA